MIRFLLARSFDVARQTEARFHFSASALLAHPALIKLPFRFLDNLDIQQYAI